MEQGGFIVDDGGQQTENQVEGSTEKLPELSKQFTFGEQQNMKR